MLKERGQSRSQSSSLDRGRKELWGTLKQSVLFIGFREEQSKASLIGAFMLARGLSRRRKVLFWL